MKTLYLMRHAKSSWEDFSLPDFDRPLNKRGKRDAPFMGKKLYNRTIFPDLILSSSAKRAKITAKIVANELGNYTKENLQFTDTIYDADTENLIEIISQQDDKLGSLLLFGHNPSFTALANQLSDYHIYNIPTSGIVGISFKINSWKKIAAKKGKMLFFDYPKRYGEEL